MDVKAKRFWKIYKYLKQYKMATCVMKNIFKFQQNWPETYVHSKNFEHLMFRYSLISVVIKKKLAPSFRKKISRYVHEK